MGVSTNSDQEFGRPVKPIHKEDCKTSMSNSEDHNHNRMIITLNILSMQECDQHRQEEEQNQLGFNNINNVPISVLATPPSSPELKKLRISSPYEVQEKNDNDDGFKTPTSLDHKIPPMLECPGAPRKKMMKRRLVFDLSREVKSMFSISFMEDLNNNIKNKKLKSSMLMD